MDAEKYQVMGSCRRLAAGGTLGRTARGQGGGGGCASTVKSSGVYMGNAGESGYHLVTRRNS
jgi:hypothetical protein